MTSVKLVVKAPNQQIEDQIMEVDLNWTVLDLKKHISSYYPSKPAVKDQRLIYTGHLLTDQQTLKVAFEPLNGENIHVHLVCAQKQFDTKKLDNNIRLTSSQARASVPSSNIQPQSSRVTGPAVPNGNQQIPFVNQLVPEMFPMFGSVPASAVTPMMWTPEQMAQMQQMYTQFLSQYNLQPNVTPAVPLNFPQLFNSNIQANEPLNPPPAPPVPVAAEQAAAGPAIRLEEPDDDDDENRDWLDLFYWLSRAVVLFSVVYFYSSFTRFVLVVGIAILMYLHQIGFIFPRDNRPDPVARPAAPIPVAERLEPNEDANEDSEPLVAEDPPSSETERCSGLRLFWVIFSSLFTSLIPETQAPVNFN